ncbi:MAG: ABC transporter ATP-binding protein [Ferroplasma sp.]|uniref:ABC transporter ATP-binding protein n=1 Tax=Ferroplasma sp. TaxID=2591003 RepID=UPI0028163B94|nr:ABC transporter ATP-binding protein [Ferroplasma sp.]WMT51997.1 MAG: ABC transporter ATP-binding protein [Ferroplasma sp.]
MLELRNISFKRGNLNIGPINFSLHPGEILTICGKNGSGKTSTLLALNREIKPESGEIAINGRCLKRLKSLEISRYTGYVQQELPEPLGLNVRDIMEINGFTRKYDYHDLYNSMEMCGVETFIDRDYSTLSGGEKRMVMISAVIYQNPEYIMLDEPSSFLDIDKINLLIKILKDLRSEGKGILLVLHDINLAYNISDSIILMKDGKIISSGTRDAAVTIKNLEAAYDAKFDSYMSPEGIRFYPLEFRETVKDIGNL